MSEQSKALRWHEARIVTEKRGHFYAPVCLGYVTEINALSEFFSQFLGAAL